jgi:acyl carrier protein
MDQNEVTNRAKKVIANVLKVSESDITDDANFIFDLGADSTQSIELVAAFEEEFDIEMDEAKALEVQTVSDAVSFISGYLNS